MPRNHTMSTNTVKAANMEVVPFFVSFLVEQIAEQSY